MGERIGLYNIDNPINSIEIRNKPTMIIENESVHTEDTNQLFSIMHELGYNKYFCNSKGELKKIENFSVEDHQLDANNKDIDYIQNFIFIKKN